MGLNELNEEHLLEEIILENILTRWKREYDLKGIDQTSSWAEVQTFLVKYEEQASGESQDRSRRREGYKKRFKQSRKGENGNDKGNYGNTGDIKNPYELPSHSKHERKNFSTICAQANSKVHPLPRRTLIIM